MTNTWPAPIAPSPVRAEVTVPGSKSITNRALIIASLADGPSLISGGLLARDTQLMITALQSLGVGIEQRDAGWHVTPGPLRGPARIDCGLAGTVMRFLPPLACLADGDIAMDGDPHARNRPMSPLVGALRGLGADIDSGDGRLPLVIHGGGALRGGAAEVDASASSQFVSGLLLSAARFRDGLQLTTTGPVPSEPHIEMTLAMLAEHGVAAAAHDLGDGRRSWRVAPGPIAAADRAVEPDLSNALPFLAAAMATRGTVTVRGWPERSTQPGAMLPGLLSAMGGSCSTGPAGLTVTGPEALHGLTADLGDVGELTPVLAALAVLADGPSTLTGIAHLRGHETDRLAALARELGRLGASVKELPDGLRIVPGPLRGTLMRTYADHRMATAAAVIGLRVPDVGVQDIGTTSKTLPDFVGMWERMLGGEV